MITRPDHLRPITVEIPVTWTPEQALAVFELIDEPREAIRARYGSQMQALMTEQPQDPEVGESDGRAIP
jgi:hypothetical protein